MSIRRFVLVAAVVAGIGLVHADESRRRQLREDIDRLLGGIAGELRDVPSDSSASDVERTIGDAASVYDKARELKEHVEGDSDAQRIADYYPDYARRYQQAAQSLREMKAGHRRLDDQAKKCEDAARELSGRLQAIANSHNPRGVEEVNRLAREHGKVGKETLETAERARYEMATWYDRVDDFGDSDGKWSDVRSNLHAAGKAIYTDIEQRQANLKRSDVCGDLARDEANPLVELALGRLLEGKRGVQTIYETMDRELGETAAALDRLEGDSDASDIRVAEAKLGELERMLDQLERAKGSDDEAERRVNTWRAIVRAARDAFAHLATLKQSQYLADNAPAKCNESADSLRAFMQGYTAVHNTDGLNFIPRKADAMGASFRQSLEKMDAHHAIMERALSDASRFDPSEGRWREVTDRHRASAQAIYEYWRKARDAAHASCDALANGQQNPEVVRALKELAQSRSAAEVELLRIEEVHRRWDADLRELRGWYKQDTEAVREAFCTAQESPGDSEAGAAFEAEVAAVAERVRSRVRPRWDALQATGNQVVTDATRLATSGDSDVVKRSERLSKQTAKTLQSVNNVLQNELNGANDPDIRARMETGKNEHKRIQADTQKCTASEVTIPGERKRIDCVQVSSGTCKILEIKPNNSAAISKGVTQAADYAARIKARFDDAGQDANKAFGGDLDVFKGCVDGGKLTLSWHVHVYDYCPPDGALYNDFTIE